jgi:MYXO-CTERM domain-containing protein
VLTVIGGPLAFPAAYYVDGAFFPFSRNHFERAASLTDGGYSGPPDKKPAPLPGAVAAIAVVLLLVMRRRIRWLTRILVAGRAGAAAHLTGRCALHTTGWFRHPAQPSLVVVAGDQVAVTSDAAHNHE